MTVSKKTVGASMVRQGLRGCVRERRRGLTCSDALDAELSDLLKRGFTAERPNQRWVG